MSIILKNENKPHYPPLEAGLYPARCYGMIVTGTEYSQMFNNTSTKMVILWELPEETIDVDKDGVMTKLPRGMSQTYTLSLNEKANLRKTLESWRGKAFSDAELREGFDIASIIGAPCMLNIIEQERSDGSTFNRISSVTRMPKGMQIGEQVNPRIEFDIRDESQPLSIMDKLPEWIQERIRLSDEYKLRINGNMGSEFSPISDDDDLPF